MLACNLSPRAKLRFAHDFIVSPAPAKTKRSPIGNLFLAYPFKIDPQSKFFRNRSVFFGRLADLSLGYDERKRLSEVCRAFALCLQTNLCILNALRNSVYKSFYKKHQKNNNKECNWNSHYSN